MSAEKDEKSDVHTSILSDFITMLTEHVVFCRKEGLYLEAMATEERISDLAVHQKRLMEVELAQKYKNEAEKTEAANAAERRLFDALWKDRLIGFDKKVEKLSVELQEDQEKEYQAYCERLRNDKNRIPKPNTVLLNLRRVEHYLVGQKNYMDAQRVKLKADALEVEMQETSVVFDDYKIVELEERFRKRQDDAFAMFKERVVELRDEQLIQREFELNCLNQRCYNMLREVDVRYNSDRRNLANESPPKTEMV